MSLKILHAGRLPYCPVTWISWLPELRFLLWQGWELIGKGILKSICISCWWWGGTLNLPRGLFGFIAVPYYLLMLFSTVVYAITIPMQHIDIRVNTRARLLFLSLCFFSLFCSLIYFFPIASLAPFWLFSFLLPAPSFIYLQLHFSSNDLSPASLYHSISSFCISVPRFFFTQELV